MSRKITVVGLGFGDEESLTLGTLRILQTSSHIYLRTEKHPVVKWMREQGISFQTFDAVYTTHDQFEEVYREIADKLFQLAESDSFIVYAVPGHPMVAERTVQILLAESEQRGVEVDVRGGGSFLDASFARLGIDPIEGFQLVDGNELHANRIDPRTHLLVGQVYDRFIASDVKLALMEVYPDDHPVTIATALGVTELEQIHTVSLYELDHEDAFTDLSSVYVPPIQEESALYRRFDFLVDLIAHLRSPKGCPWDRKQTHESLLPYLIEEAYEFIEAVAEQDSEAMADELGDVLLQIMLHSQIASEEGTFDVAEVIQRLNEKMIRRHPHVFGDQTADTPEKVKQNWEEIKRQERIELGKSDEESSILDGIPKQLPTLLRSFEMQKKAAKVGFEWEKVDDLFQKVREELQELMEAQTPAEQEEEFGDVLFVLCSVARFLKVNPELALLGACRKFEYRFGYIEEQARRAGKRLEQLTLAQMDVWWDEAKRLAREGE